MIHYLEAELDIGKVLQYGLPSIAVVLALVAAASAARMQPRVLSQQAPDNDREEILRARTETIDRTSHFERLMVAIGTIQFGILAYVGRAVVEKRDTIMQHNLIFYMVIVLFFVVTVAYLHTWKIYMGYAVYTVQLELIAIRHDLRVTSQVFWLAQSPRVPRWTRPLVKAANSMQLVSMFPVFLLAIVVVGFGKFFRIPGETIYCIAMSVLAWTIFYVSPSIVEFSNIVELAKRKA